MSRSARWVACLALLSMLALVTVTANGGRHPQSKPMKTSGKLANLLSYHVTVTGSRYHIGDKIDAAVTLTNRSAEKIAVSPSSLLRYCNYETGAPEGKEYAGASGQVIGDAPPEEGEVNMVPLPPGESLSKTVELTAVLREVLSKPRKFRISLEYCYSGPSDAQGIPAPSGCVTSNDLFLEIVKE